MNANAKYRNYDLGQTYFVIINPDEIKNHNSLLKAIDHFVEDHICTEKFSENVRNEHGDAPAVHSRMMLKILFYSYANGTYSSREIEDMLRWDPNYVYLSGNENKS